MAEMKLKVIKLKVESYKVIRLKVESLSDKYLTTFNLQLYNL